VFFKNLWAAEFEIKKNSEGIYVSFLPKVVF
jgi:hypothetical protein